MTAQSHRTWLPMVAMILAPSVHGSYEAILLDVPDSMALGAGGGYQVGFWGDDHSGLAYARVWAGPGSYASLHPDGHDASTVNATDGTRFVGSVRPTWGNIWHAALWNGLSADYVSLHPAGYTRSSARGIANGQHVGHADSVSVSRAFLWHGSAASAVNLHPAGAFSSRAYGTNGSNQAGFAQMVQGGPFSASLWSGSASSWVNLNPTGAQSSFAYAISGDQQAGWADFGEGRRAAVWLSSPGSFTNLHPDGPAWSRLSATNGLQQAGFVGTGSLTRAAIWSGSAETYHDLHQYLGPKYQSPYWASEAWGIDEFGNVVGFIRHTEYPRFPDYRAVMWAVPEPASVFVLGVGVGLLALRRRVARVVGNLLPRVAPSVKASMPADVYMPRPEDYGW